MLNRELVLHGHHELSYYYAAELLEDCGYLRVRYGDYEGMGGTLLAAESSGLGTGMEIRDGFFVRVLRLRLRISSVPAAPFLQSTGVTMRDGEKRQHDRPAPHRVTSDKHLLNINATSYIPMLPTCI